MDFNDLGWDAQLDICCRAHDICPLSIGAHKWVQTHTFINGRNFISNFSNDSNYTRSDCDCDHRLGECLVTCGLRGAVIWAIYVKTVQECVRYNGIEPFAYDTLKYNFNRWLQ